MKAAVIAIVSATVLAGCTARQPDARQPQQRETDAAPTAATQPSAQGAVAAAVAFVCSGQRLLDTPPAQLPEVVRSMWSTASADDAVAQTISDLAALGELLAPGTGPTRFRQAALAVRVEAFTASRAEVAVWWVGVLSRSGAALPQAQWSITTVVLGWESDTWKVTSTTTEAGPLPDHSIDAEPITEADLERRLAGFVDWEATR